MSGGMMEEAGIFLFDMIGFCAFDSSILLFHLKKGKGGGTYVTKSEDGARFGPPVKILRDKLKWIRAGKVNGRYLITFRRKGDGSVFVALTKDFNEWKTLGKVLNSGVKSAIPIPEYSVNGSYFFYFSAGKKIGIASSKDMRRWKIIKRALIEEKGRIELQSVFLTGSGTAVAYSISRRRRGADQAFRIALFDRGAPTKLIGKRVWKLPKRTRATAAIALRDKLLICYLRNGKLRVRSFSLSMFESVVRGEAVPKLSKVETSVIQPSEREWEAVATFNPAALNLRNKVHLLYRAIGKDEVSRIGYAVSNDGILFEKHEKPVYEPCEEFEISDPPLDPAPQFVSSRWCGSFGCEDPRATEVKEDGRIYMCYTAFDGRNPPRVALTSIPTRKFLEAKWEWERPKAISQPGVVTKSACILPEKVNNSYVIFFRVFPSIFVDFLEDLKELDGKTRWLEEKFEIPPRRMKWDSRKIGMGAPPIKTKEGWLAIYYGVTEGDPEYRYKIGAMLLDLKNPVKVICRSEQPIAEPQAVHEGKIVYPCGAVVRQNRLYVYYGGNDRVVCVGTADLDEFLDALKLSAEKLVL